MTKAIIVPRKGRNNVQCLTGRFAAAGFDPFVGDWGKGKDDDGDDNGVEIFFDKGKIAEEVAGKKEKGNPGHSPGKVKKNEVLVIHFADAGDKGGKSSDDGDKAGEKDGLAAVFVVEVLGFIEVFLFDEFGFFRENLGADKVADPVVDGIADDRGPC